MRALRLSFKKTRAFWYSSVLGRASLVFSALPMFYHLSLLLVSLSSGSRLAVAAVHHSFGMFVSVADMKSWTVEDRAMR